MNENVIYLVLTETEAIRLKETLKGLGLHTDICNKLEEELSNLYEAESKIMEENNNESE